MHKGLKMAETTQTDTEIMCFKDFLEHVPAYQKFTIEDLAVKAQYDDITKPSIEAYCDSDKCGGMRFFDCEDVYSSLSHEEITIVGLHYRCRHCLEGYKWFALLTLKTKDGRSGYAIKLGEWPKFGDQLPPHVLSLIEPDSELFLKGKESEDLGLGIGAFDYYRRVVENQWQRLLDEIIKVLIHLERPKEIIELFKKAKNQTLFRDAITIIKDKMPESLLIAGQQNPIALLNKILDDGNRNLSDNECLIRAKSIRLILSQLSDKLAAAMKEDPELREALTELFSSDAAPQTDSPQKDK
jgi:hypothetical protein